MTSAVSKACRWVKAKGTETAKVLWNGQVRVADVLAVLQVTPEAWYGTYEAFSEHQLGGDEVSCVVPTWEQLLQVALPLPGPQMPRVRHLVRRDGAHPLAASGAACRQATMPVLRRAGSGKHFGDEHSQNCNELLPGPCQSAQRARGYALWMLVRRAARVPTHALTDPAFAETGMQCFTRLGSPLRLAHYLRRDSAATLATGKNGFFATTWMPAHIL